MDWLLVALIVTVNIACFRFGLWYGFKKLTDGHDSESDKWFDKAKKAGKWWK